MVIADKITAYCKAAGVLSYRKRVLVARTLEKLTGGATADELWAKVRDEGHKVSFPAVYTILSWLITNGFVEKQEPTQRSSRYVVRV